MIELTLARAKELLAEAVAEKGADYVYVNADGQEANEDCSMSCQYVHDDQPGCIVGHVLHKAGVSLDALFDCEGQDAIGAFRNLRDVTCEEKARLLLRDAQDHQDRGVPWGEAVERALAELEV